MRTFIKRVTLLTLVCCVPWMTAFTVSTQSQQPPPDCAALAADFGGSGVGTLRGAVVNAPAGSTIRFISYQRWRVGRSQRDHSAITIRRSLTLAGSGTSDGICAGSAAGWALSLAGRAAMAAQLVVQGSRLGAVWPGGQFELGRL